MALNRNNPIGVFDSGLGGLTVVKALMRQLPREDIVYFGDTARVPYGTKSPEAIVRFSKENVGFLLKHKVKMVVVACNSSTSHALPALKKAFNLPILGVIDPGAKKAVHVTRNQKIGVIATPATINSGAYVRAVQSFSRRAKTFVQACPLFVPLVEEGWFDKPVTRSVAEGYLQKMRSSRVDTLILGCTHYPLLKKVLGQVMGPKVMLIDSAQEVAYDVENLLDEINLARRRPRRGTCQFFVSDQPSHFKKLARQFLGFDIKSVKRVSV